MYAHSCERRAWMHGVASVAAAGGSDICAVTDDNETDDVTAFVNAADVGALTAAAVRSFIERGHCIDAKDSYGHTALHLAAGNGHQHVVEVLLDAGANPSALSGTGCTPVWYTVCYGTIAITQLLIDAGGCVNTVDEDGDAPLHALVKFRVCAADDAGDAHPDGDNDTHMLALLLSYPTLVIDAVDGSGRSASQLLEAPDRLPASRRPDLAAAIHAEVRHPRANSRSVWSVGRWREPITTHH